MCIRDRGVQGGQLGGQAVVAVPAQADQVEEQGSRQGQRAQQPQGAIQGQQGGAQSRRPKGKGEDGQPAHGLSPSSVYSVAYYSGFWRKVQAGTGSRP